MSYTEKMDVLDLIIEALKEHEKALDEISYKLECCLGEGMADKFSALKESSEQEKLNNWR
jgi:hypothetical protein